MVLYTSIICEMACEFILLVDYQNRGLSLILHHRSRGSVKQRLFFVRLSTIMYYLFCERGRGQVGHWTCPRLNQHLPRDRITDRVNVIDSLSDAGTPFFSRPAKNAKSIANSISSHFPSLGGEYCEFSLQIFIGYTYLLLLSR